jgi:DNA sulfur modification protein DndB
METTWDLLVEGDSLIEESSRRKQSGPLERVKKELADTLDPKLYEKIKQYKNGDWQVQKKKSLGDSFEDEMWMLFFNMGFKVMNASHNFKMSYSKDAPNLTQQVDVVAIDEDVCLFIECKATETLNNTKDWKETLEAWNGKYPGLVNEIRTKYPNRKCKFIFATKNYVLGAQDKQRIHDFHFLNYSNDSIKYIRSLSDHLGKSARYQLLGSIFSGEKVANINSQVPAIEGKMGGLTYYTFVIEPERLLKLSFILHRNSANHDEMPTYQRLIDKKRLVKIREFVKAGNYFPNSLIVSIDPGRSGIQFDQAAKNIQVEGSSSRIGKLTLPQRYHSIYVIDGQHRLYGYSETEYAHKNTIPVVAFVDLEKDSQVKMFMDINENQKKVSKALRNILTVDLLLDSKIDEQRQRALMLYFGQKLGEDSNSPLYGRVVMGENEADATMCITIEYIKDAISDSGLFNKYKKDSCAITQKGLLDKSTTEETADFFLAFIYKCFKFIKEYCAVEWNRGETGYLSINNMMYAIIRVIGDIVFIGDSKEDGGVSTMSSDQLFKKCEPWIWKLADTLESLDPLISAEIKGFRGAAAKGKSRIKLQLAFHAKYSEYTTDELEAYIKENDPSNTENAARELKLINNYLINRIKEEKGSDASWLYKVAPEKTINSILTRATAEETKRKMSGDSTPVDFWSFISYEEIASIVAYATNWTDWLQDILTANGQLKKTKAQTIIWLKALDSYEKKIKDSKSVLGSQYLEVHEIFDAFGLE